MKKVLSLLLAFTVVFGTSVAAYAAQDDDYTGVAGSRALLSAPNTRITLGTSGDETTVSLDKNELAIIENTKTGAIVLPETHLEPGTEYEFRIVYATADGVLSAGDDRGLAEVTEGLLDGGKLRLRGRKGTGAISSAKINRKGSGKTATYRLVINTKENWGSKETDVEYDLETTGNTQFIDTTLSFKVGYGQFSDDDIDDFGEGDIVTISNDKPVILKKQFETLAKVNNYKSIQFEADDGMWSYTGRVSGMGDTNFRYTRDVVPAIVEKFEDQNFEFLTFGAGVTFPTNGEMRIDVADFSDDFGKMYTYLYRNGKLTPISTSYDTGADELVFRTNYLGSFVITDEAITDTTIIEIPGNEDNDNDKDDENNENNNNNNNNENPGTGATGAVGAAAALAAVSLAAAAVTRKK